MPEISMVEPDTLVQSPFMISFEKADLGLIQALPMCPINRTLMRCHLYVLIVSLYCTSCCTFFPNIFITEFYLICTRL